MHLRTSRNVGYTLVEILAAMAILSIIVLVLGAFFDQASKAWTRGERQVITYDLARSALDILFRDMTVTVSDHYLPFAVDDEAAINGTNVLTSGFGTSSLAIGTNDMIRFVAFTSRRSGAKETSDLDDITYWVKINNEGRGRLYRRGYSLKLYKSPAKASVFDDSVGVYTDWTSLFDISHTKNTFFTMPANDVRSDVILDNVYSFEVIGYNDQLEYHFDDFYSKTNLFKKTPARIDFRVVTLTDHQWARMDTFPDLSDWHEYVATQADVFTISCAFPLRNR